MSHNSFWKRRWKLIVNIVTIAALVVLVWAIRKQLGDTLSNLSHVKAWALLLIIPIEVLNYHAQTRLYQRLFAIVQEKISYSELYKLSLELNFVNHVFPSGGVTGLSYFNLRLRNNNIKGSKATLTHMMKLVLMFSSFEVLLILAMFVLAAAGRTSNLIIFIGTAISTLLVVGTFAFTYMIGSQQRINSFLTAVTKLLNRVIQVVRPRHPETINIERARVVFDELHENYELFKSHLPELKVPFWYALLTNITEVMAIYVVYIAFGHWVNVGAVILAYAIANFAGLISVLPGGIGVYEALMTGVLVSAGIPAALSLPVTIMYRVVNTLIQIPPGYFLYHRSLSRGEQREVPGG